MSEKTATERDTIEALADSFVARFRTGERPSVEEYAQRHPEMADELRELLPALVLLEQNAVLEDTAAFGGKTTQAAPPREIGDFSIVREIGRGGMGVVYEAVQQSLGRHVALKVLSSPGLLNPVHLERFHLEARAAARLHHTHIVPVFGVGEHDGLHYYAMQFIQGQSLDLVIDELRRLRRMLSAGQTTNKAGDALTHAVAEGLLTGQFHIGSDGEVNPVSGVGDPSNRRAEEPAPAKPACSLSSTSALSHSDLSSSHGGRELYRSVARVGLQVAEALAYAHSEGILHRDIKPSNLLLDAKGNVWITDFGLARDESSDGLTQTGDFVGTLRYMAPERLECWSDRRSDLYSLGATLYELLTLRPFLETHGRGQLVDKILHENPLPPSKADPAIPRDLETIILKAIAKEPGARYRTAAAMAEDLERFLADRPILARRSTTTERFVRWCRRNPMVAGLSGAVAALLVAASVILAVSNARIRAESVAREAAFLQATAEATRSGQIARFMKEMLEGVGPGVARGQDTTLLRDILDQTAERLGTELADQPELEAELRETLGIVYRDLGEYANAEAMIQRALALRRGAYYGDHPDIARALHQLAHVYWLQTKPECESVFRDALAMRRRLFGPEHREVADSLCGLGNELRRDATRIEEAEDLIQEALAMRRKLLGNDHLDVAESLVWLGVLVRGDAQRRPEAEEWTREALDIQRKQRGDEHPDTANTLKELGYLLCMDAETRDSGRKLLCEALAIQRKVLGDHRDTAITLYFLGQGTDDVEEAEKLYRDALAMLHRVYRDNPPASLATAVINKSIDLLLKKGDFAAATALYRERGTRLREQPGQPGTSEEVTLDIARQYVVEGAKLAVNRHPLKAEAAFREAIKLLREVHGNEHVDIADALRRLAGVLREQGRPKEGEPEVCESIKMLNNLVGDDDPLLARPYEELGSCLTEQGRFSEAETAFRKSFAVGELGSWGYWQLADILAERGEWEDVEKFSRIAADIYLGRGNTDSYFVQLVRLRRALRAQNKQTEEQQLVRDIRELGDPVSFSLLGMWLAEDGHWAEAAEKFALAAEHQPNSVDYSLYYVALARLQLGDKVGYQEACIKLMQVLTTSYAKSDINQNWRFTWTYALGPDALDDLNVPLKLAGAAVASQPQNAGFIAHLGALLYRAGRFDEAAERLEESIAAFAHETSGDFSSSYPQFFLSMTRWQLDERDEARRLLLETKASAEEEVSRPATAWNRRATLELLLREAEALIAAKEPAVSEAIVTAPAE